MTIGHDIEALTVRLTALGAPTEGVGAAPVEVLVGERAAVLVGVLVSE